MRFVKVHDKRLEKDVLHIWIEDDCPEWLLEGVLKAMVNVDNMLEKRIRYTVVDRRYEIVGDKLGKEH